MITGLKTIREYSIEGNLLSEQFENGLKVEYRYDRMNRIIKYICPDGSSIKKTYNPIYLSKTERIKNGEIVYEARFENYDLNGAPKCIQFPKNSGTLYLEYDLMGRPVELSSNHYREKQISYDSQGLLISKIVNSDLQKFEHDFLCQLTLEKNV